MKEKTKLIIIQRIAQKLSLEDKLSQYEKLAVWAAYFMEIGIFQICLLISIAQPQIHLRDKLSEYPSLELALFFLRISISLVYLITRSSYIIPVIKLLQILNVYLLRTSFCAIPLILQLAAQLYLTLRKQKRRVNFDSRLQSKYFGTKIFAIYILLFGTFLTPTQQINKNPSAVLFTSLIYYIAACLDNIYSYRTKEILRNIALCPILMAIYFICEPLVPALNTFGLVAHTIVSLCILLVIMVYAVIAQYSYHHDILYKKILNLQSRDKLLYIWSLIYFIESPSQNDLICFIKTHQSKCFNSLCPLNFNQNTSSQHSNNFSFEAIQKSIKIYLKKALQRFASQSDQIRRLFIYYRREDDPKIVNLLRQDDIYEKIQQNRISKNLQRYNDPSLEYEQMKQIQEETLTKVKLYLNHYDYFLSYINKESINMQTAEDIIQELLKLKNYFLSFKPKTAAANQQEKKPDNARKTLKKNSQGYEKLQSDTIPVKKMTLKTIILVNFMRKVYFNLPSLQKEQFSSKKLTYISEDFQQSPILIISAESYNLGKIVNWNSMAQKILLYSTKELRSKFVNDLVPKSIHKIHQKIFMKAALQIQLDQVRKQLQTFVFCFTKASYAEVFAVNIHGTNSISGNKWVVQLKHQYDSQATIIVDEYRNIVGINKNAINFGISLHVTGEMLSEELFNRLVQQKKDKITLARNMEPISGIRMQKQTQWSLATPTPAVEGMSKFYILLIEHTHEIEKTTLSRFSRRNQNSISPQSIPEPTNGFQFNFDPFLLKFTNEEILPHQQADLSMIWQENRSVDENQLNSLYINVDEERKLKNYSENIHEMIYFDKKLEFKENYDVATQFQTHPSYLQNGKMSNNKNSVRLNINKENFMENVSKIKERVPSYVYKLSFLFIAIAIICIVSLSVRLVQLNSLYSAAKERQLVRVEMINRENLIDNIGSLAVYLVNSNTYPNIWDSYLTNGWTFEELFVEIEYTNGKINKLNSEIGLLVNKGYLVNGKSRTLASYFESLSIQASARSTGQLNLTQFITEIVNQIQVLQVNIQKDVDSYYSNLYGQYRSHLYIIDTCQLAACFLCCLIMHFVLRKSYHEKVHLFKSLSAIEQEEIYRIQKNLNQHSEQIKNNELDIIQEDQYADPIDSQSIPHSKKMFNSYFRSKIIYFYLFLLVNLITAGFFFLISQTQYDNIKKIQLLTPFVNIVGEQRDSMAKMYLDVIGNIKNSSDISAQITKNIKMFEINKKGIINSLIAQQFSDDFMNFYNKIWFSPCDALNVQTQCSSIFSGILSDNLDYNYVYILTEIQKILDYRTQIVTPPTSNDPQFVRDANNEIQISFKKINFLLFELMIRLQDSFNSQTESQISFLYNGIYSDSLSVCIGAIVGVIVLILLLLYMVYKIKNLPNQTLSMVTTVVPYCILMRNEYFVEWYKNKFKNVY